MGADVSRETTESGPVRQGSRRLRAPHARGAACSAQFAGLIILAHLLVAAHTIAHLYSPSFENTSQHCAICSIGKHPTDVPTTAIVASQYAAMWIAWFASPPKPTTRCLDRATFARAPPSAAPLATIS